MLEQLYLYSYGIEQKYHRLPDKLCFNCFRTGTLIEEDFDYERYQQVLAKFINEIEDIKNVEEFPPYIEWFPCKFICDVSEECCYSGGFNG